MCTLTILKTTDGLNVFMNRDERHDRTPEQPPQILDAAHGIVGPLDPVSGGTWMAHNQNGFWACLLNGYFEEEGASVVTKSRGKILLEILAQDDPFAAVQNLNAQQYASFRLVVGSQTDQKLLVWDGENYSQQEFHAAYEDRAFFLTSSSLKQDEVINVRKTMFEKWAGEQTAFDSLPTFQYSQSPALETAPLMHRSYSRTQSITGLNITKNRSQMSYWRLPKEFPADLKPDFTRVTG